MQSINLSSNAVSGTDKASAEKEITAWLAANQLTHFVTLASNSSSIPETTMRDRLREWDSRVNRAHYGPKWRKHSDDLIWFFAFLEKPRTNPHWHLLLRVVGKLGSDRSDEFKRFPILAENTWQKLMPSGTVDVQEIDAKTKEWIVSYVAKEVWFALQYQNFVTPDEFRYSNP